MEEAIKAYNLGETNLRQKLWILTFLQLYDKYSLVVSINGANDAVEAFEKKFTNKVGQTN